MWTLDALVPTLDADETIATFDGWSADLQAYVVSATIVVNRFVGRLAIVNANCEKQATVHPYLNRSLTWPTIL